MSDPLTESDLHPHLIARMEQRGVTLTELQQTLEHGWDASDAKPGSYGKTAIFPYNAEWEGHFYEQKEVTVYYKVTEGRLVLLTVMARYGKNFPEVDDHED
ncbi:MAG: hypothetical protein RMM98_16335 [Acidobacteriota bacterium]|nr:DUF4258 domain-containing protein [Blastocatellia bacterium]MDW8241172.1 hypothetical protein [Acidobacteriota bacterium]